MCFIITEKDRGVAECSSVLVAIMYKAFIKFLIVFGVFSGFSELEASESAKTNFLNKILATENKNSLLHAIGDEKVTVEVGMAVLTLDIDEKKQNLEANVWMKMYWNDKRFKRNQTTIDSGDYVSVPNTEVWKPNLYVYNDGSSKLHQGYKPADTVIGEDGTVIWVPPMRIESFCTLDYTCWPMDSQFCEIKYGPWTEAVDVLDLKLKDDEISFSEYEVTSEWTLTYSNVQRHEKKYDGFPKSYVSMIFSFDLKRNSPTLAAIVITPAIVITLMLLSQFMISAKNPGRMVIGFSCVLLVTLQLFFIGVTLPRARSNIPVIVIYYLILLLVSLLTVVFNFVWNHELPSSLSKKFEIIKH